MGAYYTGDALFTKSNDMDIYDIFSVLLPHVLWTQRTILRVKIHEFNTFFIPNNIKTANMQTCLAK